MKELTRSTYSVNSKAAFFLLKEGAKHIEEGGKIITLATALLAAFTGFYTPYAGSKAPVEHFTRGVAKELSAKRISVNNVAPGPMDTREFGSELEVDALTDMLQHSSILKNHPRRWSFTRAREWAAD